MKKMTTLCVAALGWCCASVGWANQLDWGVTSSVWSNRSATAPLTAAVPAADGASWLVQLIWAGTNGHRDAAVQSGGGTSGDDLVVAYSWVGFGVPDALAQGRWNNSGLNGYDNTLTNGAAYFIRVWEGAALSGNGSVPTNYTYYGDSPLYVITNFDIGLPEIFEPAAQPAWTPLPPLASRVYTLATAASPTNGGTVTGGGIYLANTAHQLTANAQPGWVFTAWNDGNLQNPRTIIMPLSNVLYTASFLYAPSNTSLGSALNATGLVWQTGGSANWSSTSALTRDGLAARSGTINGGQQSWLETTVKGPGSLLFWWRISSEVGDTLQFFINGQRQNQLASNSDWQQFVTFLGSTNNYTLRWTYVKNAFSSTSLDAGLVDQVLWMPCPFAQNVPQLFFQESAGMLASWVVGSTGSFQFARILANTGSWALKAAGDIDGDGVSDLLFQNSNSDTGGWFLNADGSVRDARFWFNIGGWEIKAAGDYEGLGRSQIVFQNAAGGAAYWRLDTNGAFLASVPLGNMTGWKLRGAGDLDGDHKADLFWQNAVGQVAIWYHNPNGSIRGTLAFSTGEWALSGVADVDNDGVCDLLWQTPDTRTGGWFMQTNGTARAASFWWPTGGWKLKAAGR